MAQPWAVQSREDRAATRRPAQDRFDCWWWWRRWHFASWQQPRLSEHSQQLVLSLQGLLYSARVRMQPAQQRRIWLVMQVRPWRACVQQLAGPRRAPRNVWQRKVWQVQVLRYLLGLLRELTLLLEQLPVFAPSVGRRPTVSPG